MVDLGGGQGVLLAALFKRYGFKGCVVDRTGREMIATFVLSNWSEHVVSVCFQRHGFSPYGADGDFFKPGIAEDFPNHAQVGLEADLL